MSKAKAQGTAYETATKKRLLAAGHEAARLPEGGGKDEGDLLVEFKFGVECVVECKHTQLLTPQATLAKAAAKAGSKPVLLFWKRLAKAAPGASRRRPVAGVPELVFMTPETLLWLLEEAYNAGR